MNDGLTSAYARLLFIRSEKPTRRTRTGTSAAKRAARRVGNQPMLGKAIRRQPKRKLHFGVSRFPRRRNHFSSPAIYHGKPRSFTPRARSSRTSVPVGSYEKPSRITHGETPTLPGRIRPVFYYRLCRGHKFSTRVSIPEIFHSPDRRDCDYDRDSIDVH